MTATVRLLTDEAPGVAVLTLADEVDVTEEERVRRLLTTVLDAAPESIVVDLTRLTFTDATGINALAVLAGRAGPLGMPVTLAGCPAGIDRLLRMLDLRDRFRYSATLADALTDAGTDAGTRAPSTRSCSSS